MKFLCAPVLAALCASSVVGFTPVLSSARRGSALAMVLEKPKVKKIQKIEQLKVDSDHLIHPLKEVGF
jgi:hypothetical protein